MSSFVTWKTTWCIVGLLLSECVADQSIMILHDVSLYSVYFPNNYVDYPHMLVFLQKREEATEHLSRPLFVSLACGVGMFCFTYFGATPLMTGRESCKLCLIGSCQVFSLEVVKFFLSKYGQANLIVAAVYFVQWFKFTVSNDTS